MTCVELGLDLMPRRPVIDLVSRAPTAAELVMRPAIPAPISADLTPLHPVIDLIPRLPSALEIGLLPGIPAPSSATEQSQLIDITGNRYHYAGYASRVCRIDYASYPAVIQNASISNLNTDWPNRETLAYG